MINILRYNILLVVLAVIFFNNAYAQSTTTTKKEKLKVIKVDPPVFGFYTNVLYCDSIVVRSSREVDNDALVLAGMKIRTMLKFMPIVRHNLIQRGAEVHIIARGQHISDMPEFLEMKGKPFRDNIGALYKSVDERFQGLTKKVFACCTEENILYGTTYDLCVHEFAHLVMLEGMDENIQKKIINQYRLSISKGLWKNLYAATDAKEYFAELSTYYFGANARAFSHLVDNESAPEALREYDEGGYNLLDSLYSGLLQPAIVNMQPAVKMAENSNLYVYDNTRKTELTVVNNTGKKLFIYSNNTQTTGSEVSPYLHRTLTVWAMQIVMIKDEQGKVFGYYKAVGANCQLAISD